MASHHIRECRYCYGVVGILIRASHFFIIAGGCHSDWRIEGQHQLSATYPGDYLILVMDNDVCHKSQTLAISENIAFSFIPPDTPEMNPIEHSQAWI